MKDIKRFDFVEVSRFPAKEYVYKSAGGEKLKLIVAFPEETPTGCVFFIHGGAWRSDNYERFLLHAKFCALNGAVGASVDYRLISENSDVRDGLADCADALSFVRGLLAEKYGDGVKITVAGDSAGGYFATCLGSQKIVSALSGSVKTADFIVDFNGIVKLGGKWDYAVKEKPADKKDKKSIEKSFSPLYNISKGDAPVLIVHGDRDKTVPLDEAVEYDRALKDAGVKSELRIVGNASHAFILFDYRHDNSFVAEILRSVLAYLRANGLI